MAANVEALVQVEAVRVVARGTRIQVDLVAIGLLGSREGVVQEGGGVALTPELRARYQVVDVENSAPGGGFQESKPHQRCGRATAFDRGAGLGAGVRRGPRTLPGASMFGCGP